MFFYFIAVAMAVFCLSLVSQYQKDLKSIDEMAKKIESLDKKVVQLEAEAYKREYRLKVLVDNYSNHQLEWVAFRSEIELKIDKKKRK